MSQFQASPSDRALPVSLLASKAAKLFFVGAAATMVVLAFVGFKDFYFRGLAYPNRPIAPVIFALVIAHAVTMSVWLLLFLIQPALVRAGRTRIHTRIGAAGAVIAGLATISGILVAIRSTQAAPPDSIAWGLTPKAFMAIPFLTIVVYAAFITAAILYRHSPPIHRSLMLLGTLAAMSASISRIDPLNNLYLRTPLEAHFGPYLFTVLLAFSFLAVRCAMLRAIDRPLAIGVLVMTIALLAIVKIAPTPAWNSVATALVG